MYSPAHQKLFDERYRDQKRLDGPIAGRTRSRVPKTRSGVESATTATRSSTIDNGIKSSVSRDTKAPPSVPRRETGAIVKRRSSRLALERSDRRLRSTRQKLLKHLSTDEKFRDHYGDLKRSTRRKIEQLSDLAPDGTLGARDRPWRAYWDSDEEMKKRKKSKGKSGVREMNKYWTKEELDDEFGILEGDDHLREWVLTKDEYENYKSWKSRRNRVTEYIKRGDEIVGLWKRLAALKDKDLAYLCRKMMRREIILMSAGDTAVMDERCVGIVRRVWEMIRSGE